MASPGNTLPLIPLVKSHKVFFSVQITLRILCTAVTLAASLLTLTNKETIEVFGLLTQAKYSYSPAFRFFAFATMVVCISTLVSLAVVLFLGKKTGDSMKYFYVFLHDMAMMMLLMAACAAVTAVGQIGKYGNEHAGWVPICPYFPKYCYIGTVASLLAYIGMLVYFALTILTATKL